MKIITGRLSSPTFIPEHIAKQYKREFHNTYNGDKNIVQTIKPICETGNNFISMYKIEDKNAAGLPFHWTYFINEDWLRKYSDNIFNHSHNNDEDFENFVNDVKFPTLKEKYLLPKEKNHLLAAIEIPFESVDSILVNRKDPQYCRTVNYLRKFVPYKDEIPLLKEVGSRPIPAGIIFVLRE